MSQSQQSVRSYVIDGYRRFRAQTYARHRELFDQLADGQNPRLLFFACSDSRVVPTVILDADPGDIFECRIVGNIVPPYGQVIGGVSATIEYAVRILGVEAIIICGHSDCGAMKALRNFDQYRENAPIASWLRHAETAVEPERSLDETIRANVVLQMEHLRSHPAVAEGLERGLEIFGWTFDIKSGSVDWYDAAEQRFVPLPDATPPDATVSG